MEEKSFVCLTCGQKVSVKALGTNNRNHCPYCLWSVHLDENIPGDRKSSCKGLMKPRETAFKKNGEVMLVHQCQKCGQLSKNRLAGDDDPEKILEITQEQDKQEVEKQLWGKKN